MTDGDCQDEVVAFLTDFLAVDGKPPERVTTHISEIFLSGDRAFKMKRALRYPFLDFRTLEDRELACRRELEINRRTAPNIYKRMVPVARTPDGLMLEAHGTVVEWLIEMMRFDEAGLFDRLADDPKNFPRRLMDELANEVAALHASAKHDASRGGHAGIRHIVENNELSFDRLSPDTFDKAAVHTMITETLGRIDRFADVLDRRRDDGFVRICHGDLHLRNICLVDEKPTLFDAIEFSDDFSNIDVLYDLAFLLMDLCFRGLQRQAAFVLNRYLDIAPDQHGVFDVLPLFMSIRAHIRAHVDGAIAEQIDDATARSEALNLARDYFSLADRLLRPMRPVVVAVGGLSGSGKSRLARELAPYLGTAAGARVLRTDVLRKRLMGVAPEQRLGPEGYTREVGKLTYEALYRAGRDVVSQKYPVVLDAVFARPEQREAAEKLALEAGAPFLGLWVDVPEDIRMARADARVGNASDADAEVAKMQSSFDLGDINWTMIDSSGAKATTLTQALDICRHHEIVAKN